MSRNCCYWPGSTPGGRSREPVDLSRLAQFQRYVAEGRTSYYISGGFGGGGGNQIASWVAAHYKAESVGGTTVYDLRASS